MENGTRLLDDDGSALHNLRLTVEVQIRQARLREETIIHRHRHDASWQRPDDDGAFVVDAIRDAITERVRDRAAAHVEQPPAELRSAIEV